MHKITFLLVLFSVNLQAQDKAWKVVTAEFDSLQKRGLVGGALCRADQGKIVNFKMQGYQDRANKIPISKETIYNWGSITKTITAVCIMQLKERGRLKLDDPVTKYVPEFRWVRTDSVGISIDSVKIIHLLSHSIYLTGAKFNFYHGLMDKDYNPIRWKQISAILPYFSLETKPGIKYKYNSDGFIILGRVIENVMRESYASYVHKNIFMPLGMTTAHFGISPPHLRKHKSVSYRKRDSSYTVYRLDHTNYGYGNPTGGLFANVPDMIKFTSFLAGRNKKKKAIYNLVLSDTSLDEMLEKKINIYTTKIGFSQDMGLSFYRVSYKNKFYSFSSGLQYGFLSYIFFQRSTGRSFVYVLNTYNRRIYNYSYNTVINKGGVKFLLGYKPSNK